MAFRIWHAWLILSLAAFAGGAGHQAIATAQDATIATPDEKSFAELLTDWAILEQQLIAKEAEFHATDDFRLKEELKRQYEELVKRSHDLIEDLRVAALKAWDAGQDQARATRTLMGIMVDDAHQGKDEQVLELGDQLIARGIDPRYFSVAGNLERLSLKNREIFDELQIRQREAQADDLPRVRLTTTQGDIVIELFENEAPLTVGNFVHLVENGMYDGVAFHRVIEGFMAQTGDVTTSGKPTLGYTIPCEIDHPEARLHFAGSVSMALLGLPGGGRDTGDSQFFLVFQRTLSTQNLDRKHTVFGRVVTGFDVLRKLTRTHETDFRGEREIPSAVPDKILKAEVIRKRDHDYKPTKVGESAPAADAPPPIDPPINSDQTEGKTDDQSDGGN
ncbi:MAG TPA: peptidylprolyl isomerase [Pirellulaceae bacterium]|nr:peptidylprolyl isomerase [Pirellulaceae bacterium]